VIILDYTLFNFAGADELIVLQERFKEADWILFSENPDPVLERDYSIYGKPVQPGSMVFNNYNLHSTNIQIEGF
jgi:hypothetical protein